MPEYSGLELKDLRVLDALLREAPLLQSCEYGWSAPSYR